MAVREYAELDFEHTVVVHQPVRSPTDRVMDIRKFCHSTNPQGLGIGIKN